MKHKAFSIALALIILTVIPSAVGAQSSSRANHNAWRAQMASTTEGSGVETAAQESAITTWRNQSSSAQTSINSLGSVRVESIAIPVLFGIDRSDITPDFGDPRDGGARSHEGQDLISKTGIPIVSPTDAVVTSVGNGASSGYYVYTANPGGETFAYMHLNEPSLLTRGTKISRGDLIGFVGNTGNASGGVSHLHFEIRKNGATDPYPRLTGEFTAQEKINFLNVILNKNQNPAALATLLVNYYPDEFRSIKSQNVTLPVYIENALLNAPLGGTAGASSDLTIGSSGAAVTALQTYLINSNKGPAARTLAGAGATGYFGPITQSALAEFQLAVNISPASGVYGATTRTFISVNPVSGSSTATPTSSGDSTGTNNTSVPALPCVGFGCPPVTTPVYSATTPSGDLGNGSSGSNVVWLQNILIAANKGSSAQHLGASGATGYFGPITQNALIEYQAAVGISPASGYFGPITRAYFHSIGLI